MSEQLSRDEESVLKLWAEGYTKAEAYKRVMLSKYELSHISESALKKRIARFYGNIRMREAMAQFEGRRGNAARKDMETYEQKKNAPLVVRTSKNADINEPDETTDYIKQKVGRTASERWVESLKISEDPTALSIYGTGLFLAQVAIEHIQKRQEEIERQGLSPLDDKASPYTSQDIQAIKTAAAMIMPFAPPPTSTERKALALAGVLVGLTESKIKEDPDAYTAPPPSALFDVSKDD